MENQLKDLLKETKGLTEIESVLMLLLQLKSELAEIKEFIGFVANKAEGSTSISSIVEEQQSAINRLNRLVKTLYKTEDSLAAVLMNALKEYSLYDSTTLDTYLCLPSLDEEVMIENPDEDSSSKEGNSQNP